MHVAARIDRYDTAWNARDLDVIAPMHDDAILVTPADAPAPAARAQAAP